MQNIPWKDNNLQTVDGKKLRNWWEFIGDFDNAIIVGKSLTVPTTTTSSTTTTTITNQKNLG